MSRPKKEVVVVKEEVSGEELLSGEVVEIKEEPTKKIFLGYHPITGAEVYK